jgi:aromatic ring-cleaving dioxygenase
VAAGILVADYTTHSFLDSMNRIEAHNLKFTKIMERTEVELSIESLALSNVHMYSVYRVSFPNMQGLSYLLGFS